jgi:hypothetical protein
MIKAACFSAILGVVSLGYGCGSLGQLGSPLPTKLGVFADTGSLTELTVYVEESSLENFDANDAQKRVAEIPVASHVRAFFVNMPNVQITSSKAFLLKDLGRVNEGQTPELKIDIEKAGEGVYKLVVPDVAGRKGFLALKIGMPMGTPDRLYLLRLE